MNESDNDIVRKRRQLFPEDKYEIFIEATMVKAKGNGSITEVIQRWGIHANDPDLKGSGKRGNKHL